MNWKEYIGNELKQLDKTTEFGFALPATEKSLNNLKVKFNLAELPNELVELYRQTNGINENLNGEKIGELIWTVERVIETNTEYRNYPDFKELYMSFDQLLFFSDAGNGDLFGFVTLNGKCDRFDIFIWNHDDDSRSWVAPNLTKFIEWWTNGTIKV
ncbi:SMI1/KNR4 family protein [Runella sp. MFBS21]|uniref:SMI1/KNR4 family protein n=1 Tax=Runella sp. MFBS21 TaxID=3034018 RepID=UPI0023F85B3A|nr:SMI1/KNR4 family protein [Runella sp. MFBS21]MDF7822087.1 SMI1/KNR4 family protein [Runella sp. MFBS21]